MRPAYSSLTVVVLGLLLAASSLGIAASAIVATFLLGLILNQLACSGRSVTQSAWLPDRSPHLELAGERITEMSTAYDARTILNGLVGKTITTLTGKPNTVLAIEGDAARVGTTRSPQGATVPIKWVQAALDQLAADGEVEISVESVGYRSAFVGAVLSTLDDTEASPATMRVRRRV